MNSPRSDRQKIYTVDLYKQADKVTRGGLRTGQSYTQSYKSKITQPKKRSSQQGMVMLEYVWAFEFK